MAKKSSPTPLWPEKIAQALKNLPAKPGVYEMLNADGDALYVGKAKDLRKRVQSYFRPAADLSPRIRKMREKTAELTWTEVSSEVEALILETNLIKEKRPKFNILMRDDKNLSYFCVTITEDFPRIILTRRVLRDGNIYFGPKTSAHSVRQTIDLLQEIFRFRTTPLEITEIEPGNVQVKNPGNLKYPCLNFHLGKCGAPCIGKVEKETYREKISEALKFLKGDTRDISRRLQQEMHQAAEKKEFERAARLRDLLHAVENIAERQIVAAPDEFSADVIGFVEKFGTAFFHLFQVREGKVVNSETFSLSLQNAENAGEVFAAFLREHAEQVADIPACLVLPAETFPEEEQAAWESFFAERWQRKVEISLPQKGKRRKLLELAAQNAASYAVRNAASFLKVAADPSATLEILRQKLGMEQLPERIECFDISHLGGTETVASMSVCVDGELKPAEYRRFQLRSIAHGEIDDFKSMREVLDRRLRHLPRSLPEGYAVQKLISKKDFARCAEILLEAGVPCVTQKNDIFLIVKKNQEIRALLGIRLHQGNELIWTGWSAPEDRELELEYFLLQKLLHLSTAKKVLMQNDNRCLPDTLLERFGFLSEEQNWVYKNLVKKKKVKDSLEKVPDLIVIDGGKGQLSAAHAVLQKFPSAQKITLCSLAKRLEEVYVPGKSDPLAILKDSAEGQLLQNIRDEAHRFAITYQGKLHRKKQQHSVLDELPGIGTKTKQKLLKTFGSVSAIRAASDAELQKIVNAKTLATLRKSL